MKVAFCELCIFCFLRSFRLFDSIETLQNTECFRFEEVAELGERGPAQHLVTKEEEAQGKVISVSESGQSPT